VADVAETLLQLDWQVKTVVQVAAVRIVLAMDQVQAQLVKATMAALAQRLHLIPLVGEVVLVKLVVMLLVLLPGLVETVCHLVLQVHR
jgi:hypothetical protein